MNNQLELAVDAWRSVDFKEIQTYLKEKLAMLRQNEAEFNQINTNPDQNVFFVNLYKKQIENVYDRFKICETSCIDLFTKLADLPDLKILLEHFNDPPIVNDSTNFDLTERKEIELLKIKITFLKAKLKLVEEEKTRCISNMKKNSIVIYDLTETIEPSPKRDRLDSLKTSTTSASKNSSMENADRKNQFQRLKEFLSFHGISKKLFAEKILKIPTIFFYRFFYTAQRSIRYRSRSMSKSDLDILTKITAFLNSRDQINAFLANNSTESAVSQTSKNASDFPPISPIDLVKDIYAKLSKHGISQKLFAEKVLNITPNKLSELLFSPRPWSQLVETRLKIYMRMYEWSLSEEKIKELATFAAKNRPQNKSYKSQQSRATGIAAEQVEQISETLNANNGLDVDKSITTVKIIEKLHKFLDENSVGIEMLAKSIKISPSSLSGLMENPKTWPTLNRLEMQAFRKLHTFVTSPEAMNSLAILKNLNSRINFVSRSELESKLVKSNTKKDVIDYIEISDNDDDDDDEKKQKEDFLDTTEVVKRTRLAISQHGIIQRVLAEVIGEKQAYLCAMLTNTVKWNKLSERGRRSFLRLRDWSMSEAEIRRTKELSDASTKKRKRNEMKSNDSVYQNEEKCKSTSNETSNQMVLNTVEVAEKVRNLLQDKKMPYEACYEPIGITKAHFTVLILFPKTWTGLSEYTQDAYCKLYDWYLKNK